MKIEIADKAGFCFGVSRAVNLAQKAASKDSKVYTLGAIIHNPQEVKRLEKMSIKTVKDIRHVKEGIIILRAHGITLQLSEALKKKPSLKIVDAVCPFVKRAQDIVKNLALKGEAIIIVGEKTHPEVKALLSYAGKNAKVIEKIGDIKGIKNARVLNILSQTTQTPENFNNVVNGLKKRYKTNVFNTICKATFDRQKAAFRLANRVDLMIVVGGKNSGNTTRLAQICRKITKTRRIETADDIKKTWFKEVRKVGITAGASTPDWIINEVKKKTEEIGK